MRRLIAVFLCHFALLPVAAFGNSTSPEETSGRPHGIVRSVWIKGNAQLSHETIMQSVQTKPGTMLDFEALCDDVRRLDRTHQFLDIRTFYRKDAEGLAVLFMVTERPRLKEVKFVGNKSIRRKTLWKEADLKVGDPADPSVIEEARCRIEELYHNRGFNDARVSVNGKRPKSSGADDPPLDLSPPADHFMMKHDGPVCGRYPSSGPLSSTSENDRAIFIIDEGTKQVARASEQLHK